MPQLQTRIKRLPWDRNFITILYPPPRDKLECWAGVYKYCIIGAPNTYDPVIAVICRTIKQLAKESMYIAGAKIQVHQLSKGLNIWPLSLENAACPVKLYAFKQHGEEFPLTVPVSIIDRGSPLPLTADRVLVDIDGKWRPLATWLKGWIDPRWVTRSEHHAYMAQRQWWAINGQFFRLLDLPGELRARVFRHVLGEVIRPDVVRVKGQKSVVLGKAVDRIERERRDLDRFEYQREL